MTNHKEEAESILSSDLGSNPTATATTAAIVAVASATLYLAEQQRIANLIALATCDMTAYDYIVTTPKEAETIKSQIREGVGTA